MARDWLKPGAPADVVAVAHRSHHGTRAIVALAAMRETIGHYRVLHKLGEGGMGVVYAARDERLDRAVAIKMMHDPGDAQARSRLWREARMAAAVNHPNICQIYEVGEQDGELFLVMELLEGESLGDRLKRGACTTAETVRMGLELLAGLEALHQKSFMHRDLKPSNVFLTPTR